MAHHHLQQFGADFGSIPVNELRQTLYLPDIAKIENRVTQVAYVAYHAADNSLKG